LHCHNINNINIYQLSGPNAKTLVGIFLEMGPGGLQCGWKFFNVNVRDGRISNPRNVHVNIFNWICVKQEKFVKLHIVRTVLSPCHSPFALFPVKTGAPYRLLLKHSNVFIQILYKRCYVPAILNTAPQS
jgi:hypothetical protein